MSKVFYDKLVALGDIEKAINRLADSKEEKEELWKIVDEYVHHRMMGCILKELPNTHHEEFLSKFIDTPHHEELWDYLKERIPLDIEGFLKSEVKLISSEMLEVIKGKSSKKKKR